MRCQIQRPLVPRLINHTFQLPRHTFEMSHKRARTHDRVLPQLGGCKNSKSMDRYSHVTSPDLRKVTEKLKDLLLGATT